MIFRSCHRQSAVQQCRLGCRLSPGTTHCIGDTVRESHELDLVLGAFPVGVQREDEPQGRSLRIGMGVGLRDVAQRVGRTIYRTHGEVKVTIGVTRREEGEKKTKGKSQANKFPQELARPDYQLLPPRMKGGREVGKHASYLGRKGSRLKGPKAVVVLRTEIATNWRAIGSHSKVTQIEMKRKRERERRRRGRGEERTVSMVSCAAGL